jgi:hypothetical protein
MELILFPLTPALSLREREKVWQRRRINNRRKERDVAGT